MVKIFPAVLAFISVNGQIKRDSGCAWSCGAICYWSEDVEVARAKGYDLLQNAVTYDDFPHHYDNNEKFNFSTIGPWYEFPILSTFNVYSGGAPGPDRVIFDSLGVLEMLITHSGASGDGFVACTRALGVILPK